MAYCGKRNDPSEDIGARRRSILSFSIQGAAAGSSGKIANVHMLIDAKYCSARSNSYVDKTYRSKSMTANSENAFGPALRSIVTDGDNITNDVIVFENAGWGVHAGEGRVHLPSYPELERESMTPQRKFIKPCRLWEVNILE